MANRLTVHHENSPSYDIVLENTFDRLGEEVGRLIRKEKKLCIVTDSNVAGLYLNLVMEALTPCCNHIGDFIFPAGEENKNLDTVRKLYEYLICNHYDRGDMLVALGGGVVGDLCGYAAATYLRGIRFIQIPTTLLSQVDSSIGGKTGVDFDAYKNMVGAFHMPKLVYTNLATLLTLSKEQFASGMGEIVKHGLIKDAQYYNWMITHEKQINGRDLPVCEKMILQSDFIKRDVVEHDPTEQGDRALLNFGHTLGHAVEKLMDFKMLHGHCVALGSLCAAFISAKRGAISMEDVGRLRETMHTFGLCTNTDINTLCLSDIIKTTKSDKKMDSGTIKFILLHGIGEAYVDMTVTDDEMIGALKWLRGDGNEN